ncbi:hypothetical protein NW768_004117 [Fusarium equiseti]|uniref:Uncharacterized protein n=1 Tax=Fusarium equiseti TaxID=61235 RepID=A0ABQ8RJK1_FUSEQ|nr:hypothetical protein NW768_004117 [Fusarium equiseti]
MEGWNTKPFNSLRHIAPWTPIPLFAESLRVQHALISAVMTRHSMSTCLTGCIRDFRRLWNIDYLELFGRSDSPRLPSVTSVRHGNAFDLANGAFLEAAGIVRLHDPMISKPEATEAFRETNVYVSFVTPSDPMIAKKSSAKLWAVMLLSLFEMAFALVITAILIQRRILLGTALLICVTLSQIFCIVLRMANDPIFANQAAIHSDREATVANGAALDVHVIADSWNSSRISVICGYSSQLHALSNIPIRITRPFILKWASRSLALILTIQAALLAATTNAEGEERFSSLVWLAFYVFTLLLNKALHLLIGPENLLEKQPATAEMTGPLHFSSRRSALVFISMLPVSNKADRWAWWDVYMPDNDRRRSFQDEIERSALFHNASKWQHHGSDSLKHERPDSEISAISQSLVKEAYEVLISDPCSTLLRQYLEAVFPRTEKALTTKFV